MRLVVDVERRLLHAGARSFPCAIGRNGACDSTEKREGDGRTPLGTWPIRAALLGPASGFPTPSSLPWRWLRTGDGWSDDPIDPAYNRPVRHPHPFSAEHLSRRDDRYDAIVILGHNDSPPVPGCGSAIFLHLRGEGPTEGCIAVDRDAMTVLLASTQAGSVIDIRRHIGDAAAFG